MGIIRTAMGLRGEFLGLFRDCQCLITIPCQQLRQLNLIFERLPQIHDSATVCY